MNRLLVFLSLILLTSACNFSRQNRAEAAIKDLLNTEIPKEREYEPVEFGDLEELTYETFLDDFITQKKLELDTLNKNIKAFEEKYEIKVDSLLLPSFEMFGGLSEGKKLLKERDLAKKQLEEKTEELRKLRNEKIAPPSQEDTVYRLLHIYKLRSKSDTTKVLKRKTFILNKRFRVRMVYDNYELSAVVAPEEEKFDLD